jgi:hypothetical protein
VIGVLLVLISFLACCGAWTKNVCMIVTYTVIVTIIILAQIGIGNAELPRHDVPLGAVASVVFAAGIYAFTQKINIGEQVGLNPDGNFRSETSPRHLRAKIRRAACRARFRRVNTAHAPRRLCRPHPEGRTACPRTLCSCDGQRRL